MSDPNLAPVTELIAVDACQHPELNMQDDMSRGRTYWCSVCRKRIFISNYSPGLQEQANLAGIVGLAFGEKWGKLAAEGRV